MSHLACRALKSNKAAMIKVTNDSLLVVDGGSLSMLLSLDISATFEALNHRCLLDRAKELFGALQALLVPIQASPLCIVRWVTVLSPCRPNPEYHWDACSALFCFAFLQLRLVLLHPILILHTINTLTMCNYIHLSVLRQFQAVSLCCLNA